ncbi:putative F-box/LRR-repeat protein At3g18150 [Nicotiana tabacum]|uniref:F-box/LRR-repeat protein At3g18150 n=1 Tax=Nicotiana tabacum TaxID=4097 RepID=A0A1S3XZU4_TOBAC|nr:PREDICTED: putative FBD-associated F-box protein At5g22720 [Nicotiana tabacum]
MARATGDILPDYLIHKILSYLNPEEAAPMKIISKTWLHVWLMTKANLVFDVRSRKDIRIVDKIMEIYRDRKFPIDEFVFQSIREFDSREVFFLYDKWLGVALQNDEQMLQALLTSCPLIVSLTLEHCGGLTKIELLNLQKIRSVSIGMNRNQHVKIHTPTLEHLSYFGARENLPMLDIVERQNLKSLEIFGERRPIWYLDQVTGKISLMKELESFYNSHG